MKDEGPSAARAPERGAAYWMEVHDALLRGLTHSLSNRVGTVAAAAYLLEANPAAAVATGATLRDEGERMDGLLQALRLLPRCETRAAEPFLITERLQLALDVVAHHAQWHGRDLVIDATGERQPAYADPTACVHALLTILVALLSTPDDAERAPALRCTIAHSADTVHATFRSTADAATRQRAHDTIDWLLGDQGRAASSDAELGVHLPTLSAVRRQTR